MKRLLSSLIKEEDGVSAVIVALLMSGLLTAASLTIDVGMAYSEAAKIQNTADAVVLSLGSYLPVGQNDSAGQAEIIAKAKEYALKNGYNGLTEENIIFSDPVSGKYRSVTISLSKTEKTYLAKIVGVSDITTLKSAKVSAVPVGSMRGCTPIGISADTYAEALASGQTEHVVLKLGGGEGDTGFYGFIVVDGSNGNASALLSSFKYGYPGEVRIGDQLPMATGNKASVAKDGVTYRMSQCQHYADDGGCTVEHYVEGCPRITYVMIYDYITSSTIRVTGFAAIILEESENSDEIQGSFISMNASYTTLTSDSDFGVYTYRLTN